MIPIDTGDLAAMRPTSSAELLGEISTAAQRRRLWPLVALATGVAWLMLVARWPLWGVVVLAVGAGLTIWARMHDVVRRTVVLFYELDEAVEREYESLHNAFLWLRSSHAVWHLEAYRAVGDRKREAGADQVVRRHRVMPAATRGLVAGVVKTNIEVPILAAGRELLFFLPDRIMVQRGSQVGAIEYSELKVHLTATQFIESESPPRDAELVGNTWRYVNKSGGPDRRFKNNVQIPVMKYAQLRLQSGTGLDEAFQVSNIQAATQFVAGIGGIDAAKEGRDPTFVPAPEEAPALSNLGGTVSQGAFGWVAGACALLLLTVISIGVESQRRLPAAPPATPAPAPRPSPVSDHERLITSRPVDQGITLQGFVQGSGKKCLSPARPFYQGVVVTKSGGLHSWNLQCDAQRSFVVMLPVSKEPSAGRQIVPCGSKLAPRCFRAIAEQTRSTPSSRARIAPTPRASP
jgi:hypothetical protein